MGSSGVTWCEGGGLVGKLVPEAVPATHEAHLSSDDTSEGGAHHGAGQRTLGHPTTPQVDVIGVAKDEVEHTFSLYLV